MSLPGTPINKAVFGAGRLKRLAELERWHFWFAGRRMLVKQRLKEHAGSSTGLVIDLGCGTGIMLEELNLLGYRSIGIDMRPEGLREVGLQSPGLDLVQSDVQTLPLKSIAANGILLLDVLEHLDDGAAISEAVRVLVPGGWLVISVPAMPWLWSYRDRDAGHLRRYTRQRLVALVGEVGLTINWMGYYQFFLFPLLVLARFLGRGGPELRDREEEPLGILNGAFTWINRMEIKLGRFLRFPWGSSLVVLCTKSGG